MNWIAAQPSTIFAPPGVPYRPERIFSVAFQKRTGRLRPGETGYRSASGWKIHVGVTGHRDALLVAQCVLPLLARLQVWHKYIPRLADLDAMLGDQAGKFITIYPNPDDLSAADAWPNVIQQVQAVLAQRLQGVQMHHVTDPRECFVTPNGQALMNGVSMREVADFTKP